MIACIYRGSEFAAVHRTYLDVSGGKGGAVTAVKVVRDEQNKKFRVATAADKAAGLRLKSHKLTLGEYSAGASPCGRAGARARCRQCPQGLRSMSAKGSRTA
jgi:hypothetical protein